MKNIFKKIALFGATVMALASCASLLPNRPHRSRSSSEEISDSFNDAITSSDYPSSTRYRDSSSNGGGRSSSYYDYYDYKESDTFRLEGVRGLLQCDLNQRQYFIYQVFNERTGQPDRIVDYKITTDGSLKFAFELLDNNRMLQVAFTPNNSEISENDLTIVTEHGGSFRAITRVIVGSNSDDSDIYIDYTHELVCAPGVDTSILFHAYNRRTGVDFNFDKKSPFEITYIDESLVKFNNSYISSVENGNNLIFDLKTINEGKGNIRVNLKFDNGSTFEVIVFVTIRPDIWIRYNPEPIVVPYNGSTLVTVEAIQYDPRTGRESSIALDFDKSLFCCNGLKCQIVETSQNKVTLLIENVKSDYGDLWFYFWTESGYYFDAGIGIMSQQAYESQRWINIDFNYIRYQTECTMRFALGSYTGDKIIRSIKFVSKNKIIPDFVANNINATYYEYKFTPSSYGEEESHIVITEDNGNVIETNWGFYVEP